ncbi:MAG TPA: hypothetical protein PL012_21850, partial [Candidatus Obscuribacter sp.]|nr:hypothetical protein [Candidatus Obscuribacter sp.]
AVLIEHYAGAFPVWLSPVQAVVVPIADRHNEYAAQVVATLKALAAAPPPAKPRPVPADFIE